MLELSELQCDVYDFFFCTNLKGIHNEVGTDLLVMQDVYDFFFCTNLKGIHNTTAEARAHPADVYDFFFCTNLKGIHNEVVVYARKEEMFMIFLLY